MTKEDLIGCSPGTLPTEASLILVKFYAGFYTGTFKATYVVDQGGLQVIQTFLQNPQPFDLDWVGLEDEESFRYEEDIWTTFSCVEITFDPLNEVKAAAYQEIYGPVILWARVNGDSDPFDAALTAAIPRGEGWEDLCFDEPGYFDPTKLEMCHKILNVDERRKMVEEGRLGEILDFLKTSCTDAS